MSKVVLIRCEGYEYPQVRAAVMRGLESLGGAAAFAKPGEKILLKPNWLLAIPPEKAATTHPSVLKAVAEAFKAIGTQLFYGDSPGFFSPENAAQKTGCQEVALELGLTLADFKTGRSVVSEKTVWNKKLIIANGVLACDGLISLPKLKTHAFMKMTGAVKNQFGCVPGLEKSMSHVKLPDPVHFAQLLVDINLFVRPRLFIMDAIMAMEGNGPIGGDPKPMNVLLFSTDPVALDATACRMIALDPGLSLTVMAGHKAGLGTYLEQEIELAGDSLTGFIDTKFAVNRKPLAAYKKAGRGFSVFMQNLFSPKPYILKDKCVRCGVCVNMCPVNPKALNWHSGKKDRPPAYKYARCIRCFCCQEVCTAGAIIVKTPLIGKRK